MTPFLFRERGFLLQIWLCGHVNHNRESNMSTAHKTIYLNDYQAPSYKLSRVELNFDLAAERTQVEAFTYLERDGGCDALAPLCLFGDGLKLLAIEVDGVAVEPERYQLTEDGLTLNELPQRFCLRIVTEINPAANKALEGLYLSSGNFCTQCEPEGFRRITYFQDRPDVMALYTTTIRADKQQFPVLLSNGNLIDSGDLDDGRHFAKWHDPFPKPSYLFALVAGDLICLDDTFTTCSGREVLLQIYVEERNRHKCDHAMRSLQKAMQWDEQRFGLEYDLDRYMVVAVDDFNMGAMENKGLNIFNSKYVLACPDTATDMDYLDIEGVIGHEYFHNWTGNRITCRDWFQISLKEGLTVFRDQEFSADMNSAAVKRIEEVRLLQTHQFAEDSGPLSHPVRPESYVEINNFYTMTVYNKGAELIRMMQTLLGRERFMAGIRCYVDRHDGQAVTTDDFAAAMEDSSGVDLTQFKRWYAQAGTPILHVESVYDPQQSSLTLILKQQCGDSAGQTDKQPFHIPVRVALIGADGQELPLRFADDSSAPTERVLELTATEQRFTFIGVPADAVPSVLRDFSAPVKLVMEQSVSELAFLMAHDSDSFNRWNAGQRLALQLMMDLIDDIQNHRPLALDNDYIEAVRVLLTDEISDPSLLALSLTLPLESYVAEQMVQIDPHAIHSARNFMRTILARTLQQEFSACYARCHVDGEYSLDPLAVGQRSLKNVCLSYLGCLDDGAMLDLVYQQYQRGDNMTDVSAALTIMADIPSAKTEAAFDQFYQRWQCDPLVVDKWLAMQARSSRSDCLQQVVDLLDSEAFDLKNPNKVRSLIGAFCHGNLVNFHAADGSGYRFLQEQIAVLDTFNPQIAARLVTPLLRWPRYDAQRAGAMKLALEELLSAAGISSDLFEVVSKGLKQG